MYGYIYKTTNLLNNKIYVGQHKFDEPFIDKNYYGSGTLLLKAIQKYGKENFKVELLESCDLKQDLNEREKYWIDKLNSTNKEIGYNITSGGEGTKGYVFTEEVRKIMSEKAKKRPHPPTTSNRVYIHKDIKNKCVNPEDLEFYLQNGYELRKYIAPEHREPWNKGLTRETDVRIVKYSDSRNKIFQEGGSIGFCGLKGDDVPKRKDFLNRLNSVNKEEFVADYNEHGKCYCLKKYHFGSGNWAEICNHMGITKSNNKTWKNHGNSLLQGQS